MDEANRETHGLRYADDGLVHCQTKEEAETLFGKLKERMLACKLEIHHEVAHRMNPVIRGWANYFGNFSPSIMKHELWNINLALADGQ